jgi:replicative DNA helicase
MKIREKLEFEILAAMLFSNNYLLEGVTELKTYHFKNEKNAYVFDVIEQTYRKGVKTTITSLEIQNANMLNMPNFTNYILFIRDNQNYMPIQNFKSSYRVLKEYYIAEQCEQKTIELHKIAANNDFDELVVKVRELNEFVDAELTGQGEAVHISDIANECCRQLKERKAAYKEGRIIGITSGLNVLDKYTGGFRAGELVIIAARPGMGKTALALHIAKKAAEDKKSVLFFSLEMNDISLVDRLLLAESGVDAYKYKNGNIEEFEIMLIENAAKEISNNNINIDDKAKVSVPYIRTTATMKKNRNECDLIIVDYLQLADIDKKAQNREREVANATRDLKLLSKELNVPIILLSQLNREVESEKLCIPKLAHLRESGAIEQDADIVLLLTRPNYYKIDLEKLKTETKHYNFGEMTSTEGLLLINIAKQRNGKTGYVFCKHNENINNFFDI